MLPIYRPILPEVRRNIGNVKRNLPISGQQAPDMKTPRRTGGAFD
jgi:hypothetical protein